MSFLVDQIQQAIEDSELVAAVAALRNDQASLLFGETVRDLASVEIEILQRQGNRTDDWSKVRVAAGFRTEGVWNNDFLGPVVLGIFSADSRSLGNDARLPSGVYHSTLDNVEIGNEAVIYRVGLLNNSVIHERAAVAMCASVTCTRETSFGCGRHLPVGIETGGRDVRTYAEITVGVADRLARLGRDQRLRDECESVADEYQRRVSCARTIIGHGAIVRDTGQVVDSYVGPSAIVENARLVSNSCLLSNSDEPSQVRDGAWVQGSILQWGAEVGSMGLVDESVLCEHSHVDRHGKVTQSIIGPNTSIGEGEVTACLVGPFVGFHHQALLIAAMWPEGKGNVGYGANVGSNHTGRAPDQEIWCGEGTFFGLASNIKFPTDFSRSPYSIVASGVTCLPQRVEFPFSLINSPAAAIPDLSPSFNQIFPGWVLAENMFMLKRNEGKYQKRNKARREMFDFEVLRPEVIDMVVEARGRLSEVDGQAFYTNRQIVGLGKNYLSEAGRLAGIEAYDSAVKYYALKGLLHQFVERGVSVDSREAADLLARQAQEPRWEHQRQILVSEFSSNDIGTLLRELVDRERQIADAVQSSKAKDDARGRKIIADYEDAHDPAGDDSFVQQTWETYRALEAQVNKMIGHTP